MVEFVHAPESSISSDFSHLHLQGIDNIYYYLLLLSVIIIEHYFKKSMLREG